MNWTPECSGKRLKPVLNNLDVNHFRTAVQEDVTIGIPDVRNSRRKSLVHIHYPVNKGHPLSNWMESAYMWNTWLNVCWISLNRRTNAEKLFFDKNLHLIDSCELDTTVHNTLSFTGGHMNADCFSHRSYGWYILHWSNGRTSEIAQRVNIFGFW